MDYYKEMLDKLESLLKEDNIKEAKHLLDEELSQIYIPKDIEEKLHKIKNDLNTTEDSFNLSDDDLVSYLKDSKEKQLIAVSILNNKNLRDYVSICNDYLSHDGFKNAKVLLIDSLIRQELNETIIYNDEGLGYEFIPKYQLPIEESDGYKAGYQYLSDYYMKDPSKLKMAKSLLYKELMLALPINLEKDEGIYIAKDICDYIEEAFNKDICIKKENLN